MRICSRKTISPGALLFPLFILCEAAYGAGDNLLETFETGKSPEVELHVSATGNDSEGDGSEAMPFASVRRAIEDAVAGTAIRIHAGIYPGGIAIEGVRGTKSSPIWIGGIPGEPRPVVDGGNEGLLLNKVQYLIIHDLVVRNSRHNGINAADGGHFANPDATRYVLFRGIEIHNVGGTGNQDCLKLSGVNDYVVTQSVFRRCGGGSSGSGIDQVGCHNGEVRSNFFQSMSGNAVQAKGGSANIRIHGNTIIDGGGRAVNIGGSTNPKYFRPPLSRNRPNFEASNIQVTSNVIVGSDVPLAFVGAVDSISANNTIVEPSRSLILIAQQTTSDKDFTFRESGNNSIINNLFYFNHSDLSEPVKVGPNTDARSFEFANNLWYAYDAVDQSQPDLPVAEANGIAAEDPLFVDPATGDYRLQDSSPARARGRTLLETVADHSGTPFSQPPSIGAYEIRSR